MPIHFEEWPPRKAQRTRRRWPWPLAVLVWLVGLPYLLCVVYLVVHPPSMFMLASLLQGEGAQRTWVPLARISPVLVDAVIAAEDAKFCSHHGVDTQALVRVLQSAPAGRVPSRGASTIPMQTVKNLFLWQNPALLRKPLEFPLALWADALWSKRRTLEIYLNIAQWGEGIFGIEAAARHYFGTSARGLSRQQALLLATSLPNPAARNPASPAAAHRELAAALAARISREGRASACVWRR